MFPEFEKYAKEERLLEIKLAGNLAAQIPRILGQGKTKAIGLDLSPSLIERKQEFVALDLSPSFNMPPAVREEQLRVKTELDREMKQLCSAEGSRSLASNVIRNLNIDPPGNMKNNYFYAGRFLLIPDEQRTSWSWSITPYYPIIEKIPPDFDYLVKAFTVAEEKLNQIITPVDVFEKQLELSWWLARHFAEASDKVLLSDVARMYLIASQDKKFWTKPQRRNFTDIPDASFIANLINYKSNSSKPAFEFMPATLNDSYRKNVYQIPLDREGTQTRPYVYIVKKR